MATRILAHGIDIVEIARIERMQRDHGERFLDRVFTPRERAYCCESKIAAIRLAGRFAAKEAVLKVLGTGWRGGIEWTDIEILPDPLGKPICTLQNQTAKLASELGITQILVSISHTAGLATASAIGVGESNSE